MASEAAAAVTGLAHFVGAVFMFLISPAGLALAVLAFVAWLAYAALTTSASRGAVLAESNGHAAR